MHKRRTAGAEPRVPNQPAHTARWPVDLRDKFRHEPHLRDEQHDQPRHCVRIQSGISTRSAINLRGHSLTKNRTGHVLATLNGRSCLTVRAIK